MQNALGLNFGDDYGRSFFSLIGNALMRRAFQEAESVSPYRKPSPNGKKSTVGSFRELHRQIEHVMVDNSDFQAGQQTMFLVEKLAEMEALTLAEGPACPADHPALKSAISFSDVIREKQVIYFYLPGMLDPGPTSEIARLAVYSLLAACEQFVNETGKVAPTHVICDEAQ